MPKTIPWHYSFLFAFLFTLGCSNNLKNLAPLYNSVISSTPNVSSTGSASQYLIQITNILPDTTSGVASSLNVIGDGTGSIGTYCATLTNCQCYFYYSTSTASNVTAPAPLAYSENDLLRCSYSGLPNTLSSFGLAITNPSDTLYSNQLTYNIGQYSTNFDTTNLNNFFQPIRFQCRDTIQIPYSLDGSVYDPIQSEDPHLTYPLNFYTSNLGLSIQALASASTTNANLNYWNCPSILNPNMYIANPTALKKYSNNANLNFRLYSFAPTGTGNYIIDDGTSSQVRSQFYLAKNAGGVFTLPVDAMMAPAINTSSGAAAPYSDNPLGYAAPATQTNNGIETCPSSSVSIPNNTQWAKLWLFRASLPQRSYYYSTNIKNNINAILCNPGDWVNTSSTVTPAGYTPVLTGCYLQYPNAPSTPQQRWYSFALSDVGTTVNNSLVFLADRYLNGSQQCVRLQNTSQIPCYSSNTYPGPACSSTNSLSTNIRFDIWEMELPYYRDNTIYKSASTVGCAQYVPTGTNVLPSGAGLQQLVNDPFQLCNATPLSSDDGTSSNFASSPTLSTQNDVQAVYIDATSRFDYVFVVTPTTVNTQDLSSSNANSNIQQQYTPLRYKLASDCTSTTALCTNSTNSISYELITFAVGGNANSPTAFPVCVLQNTVAQ